MNENYNYREDNSNSVKKSPIRRIMRWCVYLILFTIYGTVMIRLMSTCETGEVKRLYLNKNAVAVKEQLKSDFSLYKINVQEYITRENGGLYAVSNKYAYYLESTNQVQITFRNKKNNIEELRQMYDMNQDEPFVFVLKNEKGEKIRGRNVCSSSNTNYLYDTILFDGVYIDTSVPENIFASEKSVEMETNENGIAVPIEEPAPKEHWTLHFYINYNGADNSEIPEADCHIGRITVFNMYTNLIEQNIMKVKTQNTD